MAQKNYTMQTAALKATTIDNALINCDTLNAETCNATNIVSNSIQDSSGSAYLTKSVADGLYNNGSKSYDWTPDYSAGVKFVCSPITTYTVPCNGWIIVYQKITTALGEPVISVNGVEILSLLNKSESGLNITGELSGQFLVGKNDVITGGVAGQEGIFYPCKAETAEE